MKPINESLYRKQPSSPQKSIPSNVRKPVRKVRKDKKHDIQIPLTEEQRRLIKVLARNRRMTPTSFCSMLLKNALIRNHDYPEVQYPSSKSKTCHAKFEEDYFEMLFGYTVRWDCSLKKAAHRILLEMLRQESRG